MGIIKSLLKRLGGQSEPTRVLMVGLDNAGKTTILYKLKLGETVTTIPTIGFNVETVEYKNLKFTVWDIGGQESIRQLWKHYYANTDAIIYVIDSNDLKRIKGRASHAKEELHRLLNTEELSNALLLIYANKQDLPNAIAPEILDSSEYLDLRDKIKQNYKIFGTIAKNYGSSSSGSGSGSGSGGSGGNNNDNGSDGKKKNASGIYQGLEWLSQMLKHQRKKIKSTNSKTGK